MPQNAWKPNHAKSCLSGHLRRARRRIIPPSLCSASATRTGETAEHERCNSNLGNRGINQTRLSCPAGSKVLNQDNCLRLKDVGSNLGYRTVLCRGKAMTALLKASSGALMRPPLLGLMAWTTVLLWTPLAHALMVLQFSLLGTASQVHPELRHWAGRLGNGLERIQARGTSGHRARLHGRRPDLAGLDGRFAGVPRP